jgi:glycosyltransferase involved in cell wall biosynthesis
MNVLIVKSTVPFWGNRGTDVVSLNLAKLLSLDHRVSFLALAHSEHEYQRTPYLQGKTFEEIHIIPASNKTSIFHKLYYKILYIMKFFTILRSLEVSYNTPRSLKQALSKLTESNSYDIVIIEYWYCGILRSFVHGKAIPVLLIHDASFINNERHGSVERSMLKRIPIKLYHRFKKWEELKSISKFSNVLALSDADIQHIQKEEKKTGTLSFQKIPITMDELCQRAKKDQNDIIENSLYFIGSMNRFNNLDSVLFFFEEVYPYLQSSAVDVTFYIIGSCKASVRRKLEKFAPIQLVGIVDDLVKALSNYQICVAPLRIGSGIKIKILEAFALRKPVVTTSVGAEGIDFYEDHHQGVRDEPKSFAKEIEHLLRDVDYYNHVKEKQWQYAYENLTIQANRKKLQKIMNDLYRSNR